MQEIKRKEEEKTAKRREKRKKRNQKGKGKDVKKAKTDGQTDDTIQVAEGKESRDVDNGEQSGSVDDDSAKQADEGSPEQPE